MADKKFSQLDPAGALDGNETVPMIQGGVPVRSTVSDILAKQHGHAISDVTGLQTALDGKSATSHTHDDRYYTETEVDTALSGKSNTSHNHNLNDLTEKAYSSLTGRPTLGTSAALDVAPTGDASATQVVKGNDSRLSDARTPTTHTHSLTDITDEGALASKNTVATADIDNDAVSNAKIANMAVNTIKGRITTGTGDPEDLTATDVRTIINVADGATANASDASLRDRSTHTGTQASSTISDLTESVQDIVGALLVAGTNITLTYNDVANTLTIDASGGGGSGLTHGQVMSRVFLGV